MGTLQQMSGTVLCDLYPEAEWRMTIIYISMAVTAVIGVVVVFEIMQQRKLMKVQLEALFVCHAVEATVADETSLRMNRLSQLSESVISSNP